MTDNYIPDPISTYTPRKPVMRQTQNVATSNSAPSSAEMEKLEGMSREELLALCKRFAGVCGLSIAMTKEETAQAMLDSLAEVALKPLHANGNLRADINARMNAIDRWLDRVDGKAIQRIEQKVEHSSGKVSELTNEQLMLILSRASVASTGVVDAEYSVVTENAGN